MQDRQSSNTQVTRHCRGTEAGIRDSIEVTAQGRNTTRHVFFFRSHRSFFFFLDFFTVSLRHDNLAACHRPAHDPHAHKVWSLCQLYVRRRRPQPQKLAVMAPIRRFSWSLAGATAAATLWLTFHAQAVALGERESTAVGRDAPANDPNVGPEGGGSPHTGNTNKSRTIYGGKPGVLPPRTSVEAPRGAEGIRKRLAAGRGGTSSEQDVSEVAINQENSRIELDEHASKGACKRRGYWGDREPYEIAADVCSVVGGIDVHRHVHQESGRPAAAREGDGAAAAIGQAPVPTEDDDATGPSRGRNYSNVHQVPTPSRSGAEESINSSVLPGSGRNLSAGTPGMGKSNEVHFAPELEHDPWEGYRIIAEADPVTSWEILREVRNSCTLP